MSLPSTSGAAAVIYSSCLSCHVTSCLLEKKKRSARLENTRNVNNMWREMSYSAQVKIPQDYKRFIIKHHQKKQAQPVLWGQTPLSVSDFSCSWTDALWGLLCKTCGCEVSVSAEAYLKGQFTSIMKLWLFNDHPALPNTKIFWRRLKTLDFHSRTNKYCTVKLTISPCCSFTPWL